MSRADTSNSANGSSNTTTAGKKNNNREIVNGSATPRTKMQNDIGTETDYNKPAKKGEGKGSNTGYVNKDSVDNSANIGNSR